MEQGQKVAFEKCLITDNGIWASARAPSAAWKSPVKRIRWKIRGFGTPLYLHTFCCLSAAICFHWFIWLVGLQEEWVGWNTALRGRLTAKLASTGLGLPASFMTERRIEAAVSEREIAKLFVCAAIPIHYSPHNWHFSLFRRFIWGRLLAPEGGCAVSQLDAAEGGVKNESDGKSLGWSDAHFLLKCEPSWRLIKKGSSYIGLIWDLGCKIWLMIIRMHITKAI